MPINIQDNLIHPKERHVRTELWKDRIYHIPFNPYKFPLNDGSGDFIPLPRRFQKIITEFRKFIDEQKAQESTEEEKQQAKDRIKEIYLEIKKIIQQEIDSIENPEEIKRLRKLVKFLQRKLDENTKDIKSLVTEIEKKAKELKLLEKPFNISDLSKLKDINQFISTATSLEEITNWLTTQNYPNLEIDLTGELLTKLLQLPKDSNAQNSLAKTKGPLAQYKDWTPLQTLGNGNCFLNAFSILLVRNTSLATKLRIAMCLLLIKEPWRLLGTKAATEAEQLAALKTKLITEGLAKDKSWLATDDINFLSVILKRPLRVLYFPLKEQLGEETYNKLQAETGGLAMTEFKSEAKDSEQIEYISEDYWTILHVGGNHFVPLISEKEQTKKQKKSSKSTDNSAISLIKDQINHLLKKKATFQRQGERLNEKLEQAKKTLTKTKNNQDLAESEEAKFEKLKYLRLGLKQSTARQFKKFNQEVLDSEEVTELLEEWKEQRKIALDRKNACFIENDNAESLIFCYQPPKGDFHALDDFLWYRNNIWYETVKETWRRINHENALVTVKRSTFIHNYDKFFLKGANGIFHNHPLTKNTEEICMCPNFLEGTEVVDFISDWQPDYQLFKIKKELVRISSISKLKNAKGEYSVFSPIKLEPFDPLLSININTDLTDSEYLLLPKWYDPKVSSLLQSHKETARLVSSSSKISLKEWLDNYQANRGQNNEHLLKKIHVNFIWNSKVVYPSKLSDFDFDTEGNPILRVEIRANPAEIIYIFTSKKVLFRLSEDVGFTSQAESLMKIARGMAQSYTGINFDEAVRNSLHDIKKKKEKPQEERKWERSSQLITDSNIAKMTLGTIPALIDASHTRNDYTLSEFALRFDANNLRIRLEYNRNQFERYQMTKQLKRHCNKVFNAKRIGDWFHKGYIKTVANIFEGDRDGYFAGLLAKGVYFYEKHPNEYFEEKLKEFSFKNEISNNEAVAINTTIYESYSSAIGRDDQVHVDNLSWVWKESYLRPKNGGADLFPKLIDQMKHNIKQNDDDAWKFDGYKDGDAKIILQKDVEYNWYMKAFSSGREDKNGIRTFNDGTEAILNQKGADWELKIGGKVAITKTVGNPDAIRGGTEFEDIVENLPDMLNENQTAGLESMEQTMQAEAGKANEFDKEILEELQSQEELNDERTKQNELELEPETTKDKQKQDEQKKEKEDVKEDEDDVARSSKEK